MRACGPGTAPTGLSSHRYRNFRTFTSPRPTQFSCVAVDSSGEIVSAGTQDSFEVFIWSMQTGRLLDVRAPSLGGARVWGGGLADARWVGDRVTPGTGGTVYMHFLASSTPWPFQGGVPSPPAQGPRPLHTSIQEASPAPGWRAPEGLRSSELSSDGPQVLSGHEGPISGLCFNPMKSVLASASWDRTVRLWDMADSWRTTETLALTSDGEWHPGEGPFSVTCLDKPRVPSAWAVRTGSPRVSWAVGVGSPVVWLGVRRPSRVSKLARALLQQASLPFPGARPDPTACPCPAFTEPSRRPRGPQSAVV